jgi:hypothetical protein
MVDINQYQQQTTPQGAQAKATYQSSGIGEALAAAGRSTQDLAFTLVDAKKRREDRKAQAWYAENAPQMQSQIIDLQLKALAEGPEDGDGLTGAFLDEAEKVLQAYAKSAPNKRAQEILKARGGEWLVGQKDKMVGEEFVRGQKYVATAFERGMDSAAKVVAADPTEFVAMVQDMEFSLQQSPLTTEAKADLRVKLRQKLAVTKVAAEAQADPAKWLETDKSKDIAWNLLPLEAQQKMQAQAENEVRVRTAQEEAAREKAERETKRSAYDMATESVLNGTPYAPPPGMRPKDQQDVEEYRLRLAEQERYKQAGGAIESDPAYRDELLILMSSSSKAPFLESHIDKTRLSERDFQTFRTAQVRMSGDRSTRVSDVSRYVNKAMAAYGLDKGKLAKQRERTWNMVMLDAVAQKEDQLGRPLDDREMDEVAAAAFRQTDEGGFFRSPKPTVLQVDPQLGPIISGFLRDTTVAVSPENIVAVQQDIEKNREVLAAQLEAEGIPVTKAALAERYGQLYRQQFAQ